MYVSLIRVHVFCTPYAHVHSWRSMLLAEVECSAVISQPQLHYMAKRFDSMESHQYSVWLLNKDMAIRLLLNVLVSVCPADV